MVKELWVREHLAKLGIHKSMGSEGLHPLVLGKQVNTKARLPTIIFERLCQSREVPKNCEKANVTAVFKKEQEAQPREVQGSQPHLCPWKGGGVSDSEDITIHITRT